MAESTSNSNQEKVGKVKKCPQCGEVINPLEIKCSSCGFQLNLTISNNTLKEFLDKLMEQDGNDRKTISRKTDLISHFPIPNNKEDLFEFLTICIPQIDQDIHSKSNLERRLLEAWLLKSRQLLLKANTLFKDDKEFLRDISGLEKKVELKLIQIKRRNRFILLSKVIIVLLLISGALVYLNMKFNKKTDWEKFVVSVNDKYKKEFEEYKESNEYKTSLLQLEKNYKWQSLDPDRDTIISKIYKNTYKKSDLYFFVNGINYFDDNHDYASTVKCLDSALALNPSFALAYFFKGYFLPQEYPDSAIQFINKAIEYRQDFAKFYFRRGVRYEDMNQQASAVNDYLTALKISPDDCLILASLAANYINQGATIEGCKYWSRLRNHKYFNKFKEGDEDFVELMTSKCK